MARKLRKLVWKDGEMIWLPVATKRRKKARRKPIAGPGGAIAARSGVGARGGDLPPMPLPSYRPPRFATESRVGVPEFTPGREPATKEFIAMLESLQGLTVVLAGPEGNSWLVGIATNGRGEIRDYGLFDLEPISGDQYGHIAIVPDSIESVIFAPYDQDQGRAYEKAAKFGAAAIILTDAFESI